MGQRIERKYHSQERIWKYLHSIFTGNHMCSLELFRVSTPEVSTVRKTLWWESFKSNCHQHWFCLHLSLNGTKDCFGMLQREWPVIWLFSFVCFFLFLAGGDISKYKKILGQKQLTLSVNIDILARVLKQWDDQNEHVCWTNKSHRPGPPFISWSPFGCWVVQPSKPPS